MIGDKNMKKTGKNLVILFLLIIILGLAYHPVPVKADPQIWYAAAGSGGLGDCTIYNECSLWEAVDLASNGDTILLRYGPYVAQSDTDDEVLYIDKSLTIIGGCNADYTVCELGHQYTSSIMDGDPHNGWPYTRVITIQGTPSYRPSVVLKNLHIVRGNGFGITNDVACETDSASVTVGCGGGIYANQVASLSVEDCLFYDNSGAIEPFFVAAGAGYGGAIYLEDVDDVHIINNTFNSNQAYVEGRGYGGAIALVNNEVSTPDQIEIDGNTFMENDCGQSGTTMDKGCAIYMLDTPHVTIENNSFTDNNTPSSPQTLAGAAVYANNSGGMKLLANTFRGTWGSSVVEVWNDSALPDDAVERNKFWENDAFYLVNYTGIYWVMIRNNFFGHYAPSTSAPERGGGQTGVRVVTSGVPADNPTAYMIHNTFAAIPVGFSSDDIVLVEAYYNIFAYVSNVAVVDGASTALVGNLFWGNFSDGNTGSMPVYGDPYLADLNTGDFHISYQSAAKDHASFMLGSPTNDIDGQARPFGTNVMPYDIGADECFWETFLPLIHQ